MVRLKKGSNKRIKPSVDGIDRISNLPDALISKILSLLPTENAVATSALSKRWRYLWTSVDSINLVQEQRSGKMKKTKFLEFVNRVIEPITPLCIQIFRLKCTHILFDPNNLERWISDISQNVQELDLYLFRLNKYPFDLQMNHFRFNKIVILKLKGDIYFKIPSQSSVCFPNLVTFHLSEIRLSIATDSSVSFPNLMSLHFHNVLYEKFEAFHKLVSSCPIVLKELYIKRHSITTVTSLSIGTPSYLRSLQLVVLKLAGRDLDFKIPAKAFICFPNLQQLHVSDITFDIAEDSSVSFPKLKILYFDFYAGLTNGESAQKLISSCPVLHNLYIRIENWKCLPRLIIHIPSLTKLQLNLPRPQFISWSSGGDQPFEVQIDGVHKLQFLSISTIALKVVRNGFSDFYYVKRLEVDVDDCSELSLVINNMLEYMDYLEHLAIRMDYKSCSCAHKPWSQPLNVPKCLAWRVTTISFNQISDPCSGDCRYQLEFLRYILKNARVLQELKLSIERPYSLKERKQLLEKFSKFPKESQACQLKFT